MNIKNKIAAVCIPLTLILAGCAYSPVQSDRLSTIKSGDTKEHLIAVAGWPDDVETVNSTTKAYVYKNKHWFSKGQDVSTIYVKNGKVFLVKNVEQTIKD